MSIPSSFTIWWMAIRPKTLPASISPILLGSALAFYSGEFQWVIFLLAMLCAVALQIAVNLANDFFDAKAGVDTPARQGPTRVTQSGLVSERQIKIALLFFCVFALVSGGFIVWRSSMVLLYLGIASLVAVFAYSGGPKPLASQGLGEVTVLIFFGWLAVAGVFYAHSLSINLTVLGYGTVAGLISAAIMLVNNIRDIHTDTVANKRTLAVRVGEKTARNIYQWLLIGAIVVHLWVSSNLGFWSFAPMLLVAPLTSRLVKKINFLSGEQLNQQLANTAKLELAYCGLMSALLVFLSF